jgi:hypothetical protein
VALHIQLPLVETGTYTILVATNDPGYDGTGDYSLTLAKAPGAFVVSPGDQGGAISNGVQNGTASLGDLDMCSDTANQGSTIDITITELSGTVDYTPWIRLIAPNGAVIANSSAASSAHISVPAPSTGTYTVILGSQDVGFDGTGTYSLSVTGVNLAPRPNFVARRTRS